MTVKQLLKKFKGVDPDTEVVTRENKTNNIYTITGRVSWSDGKQELIIEKIKK
jgi:hypothetical protein